VFCGVPRVFERIHGGVQEQLAKAGGVKAALFHWAYARKLYYMNQGWRYDEVRQYSTVLYRPPVRVHQPQDVRV
jgi:long-chain acyl-CoA synthetase